jgi:hypothetical protein
MRVPFEKVLWQVVRANSRTTDTERPRNLRMEDILRRRDAFAGRIALGLVCTLAVSSMAFAGYALQGGVGRSDFPMAVPSLPSDAPNNEGRIAFRFKDQDPITTGSIGITSPAADDTPQQDAAADAADQNSGRGYVLRKILRRSALVEGPSGMREVTPGSVLPGAGRVVSIFRSRSGWVVVTSETIIREGAVLGLGTASNATRRSS